MIDKSVEADKVLNHICEALHFAYGHGFKDASLKIHRHQYWSDHVSLFSEDGEEFEVTYKKVNENE